MVGGINQNTNSLCFKLHRVVSSDLRCGEMRRLVRHKICLVKRRNMNFYNNKKEHNPLFQRKFPLEGKRALLTITKTYKVNIPVLGRLWL